MQSVRAYWVSRFVAPLFCLLAPAAHAQGELDRIKLPPGFEISVFADRVPNARSLALGRGE